MFAKINQIPRPSKREEKMIEYLKNFGESRGLETKVPPRKAMRTALR